MSTELEELFTMLARSLYETDPALVAHPLEVDSLAARWLPYAQVRRTLGVPTNEDYELLLMRLLSGEEGFVFADEALQDDLRRETGSLNPDLTALRTYGAARVTLAREAVRRVLDLAEQDLPPPPPAAGPSRPSMPVAAPVPDPSAPPPRGRAAPKRVCQYCGQDLPAGYDVHFCAHCGFNVQTLRCAGCSAEMEPTWRFCVNCGRASG